MIKATKPEIASYEEYINEIKSIWDTGSMTNNGPKVQKLRNEICKYIGCQNAELFSNGHLSLLLALKALDLPENGEVLTSPFTFASTTNAIVQSGLVPVFCDIDETYNIDVNSIERNITAKTCAIVTPHIFGIPCHVNEIEKIAKDNGLKTVFDGAQAFGTSVNGKNIGNFGDITMFSLHAIKIFNAVEGGILTFHDTELKQKLELLRNFGISYGDKNDVIIPGINAKLTEFAAAMGLVNLPHLSDVIQKRRKLAQHYKDVLSDISGISVYNYCDNIEYNYAYFPIDIDMAKTGVSRDSIWKELQKKGIETRKLYDTLTCDFSCYSNKDYRKDIQFATELSKRTLDLPMYSMLECEDIDHIAETMSEIIKKEK